MDFLELVVRYETALWNSLDHALRAAGAPSAATLWALRSVRRHDGACRVHELRQDLQISVGAASKLVDRLERDRLATRTANPADGRSSLVSLTEAGARAHDRGVAVVERELAAHLTEEVGLAETTAVLQRLLARVATTTAVAS